MALFDAFKKCNQLTDPKPVATSMSIYHPAKKAELTKHSKHELMVQRVTLQDMEQFTLLPFVWNSEIKKEIGPNAQPFAFMDIVGSNVFAACLELDKMNNLMLEAHYYTPDLPRTISIPIDDIDFTPGLRTGSSKIMCTPYTFSGRLSKYPVSLFFKTAHMPDVDSTHGELFFTKDGIVGKAEVICWRKKEGYFFYYKTIHNRLCLDRIVSTIVTNDNGLPGTIYKSPSR